MCGTALTRDEAAGEVRRVITLVTSDLKGSTALGERLDPEALREVLNRYFAVMRAVFESHGGTIEKIIGDAIVAVFGLPFRHDDDPLRALEAAAESQRALATLNDELEAGYGVRLVVRTGVATGEVTFGAVEAGQHVLLGPPVDIATVMEQNSPPLEVLVHASTRNLVGEGAEFGEHPAVSPKGSDELLEASTLVAVRERVLESEAVAPEAQPGMRICPGCGEQSPDRMRFCTTCGASLTEAAARESRRTVTIVFAMPKVQATGGEAPGPETLRDVMSRYFDAMRTALERHGGTVEKFIGDAVMAVFGLPVRHEDDAVRAVRAASDMQAALAALNPDFRTGWGLELENHIGVNSGEVIAGDASTAQRMVTGDAVNTAARLEQAAGSGEIVLGGLTYRLARDQIDVEVMEPLSLKGKAEPVPAYRLVSIRDERAVDGGPATPFVGRGAEMGQLNGTLERAISERRATFAAVVGDAGVGKSRLIREFGEGADERAQLVRGRCLPYGDGITFWPLAEVVREAAGISGEDSPTVALQRLHGLLEGAGVVNEREAIVERVAAAINLTPAQFPVAELMWGGRRLLEALAGERPTIMLVDDIHWAESTFLEFIDHLVDSVSGAPLVILGSARHELLERHGDWAAAHDAELIRLYPLSEADSGRIIEELLGSLEPAIRARIAAVAEGNPLYVEQIVSMLVETGALDRGPDGWVVREPGRELQIPPTVHALVASRLDALQGEERSVVDPASVIGLSFPLDAVTELVEETIRPNLDRDLQGLTSKQLVRRLPDEEAIYRFSHQVIRDTAYGSLLKRARAALHERFVTWAERVNRERGRELEFEEILGFHLEQAYGYRTGLGIVDPGAREIGERAAAKLSSAGRRALERGDLPAAVSLLRRSVALLPRESTTRIELMVDLADGLGQQGDFGAAAEVLDEAGVVSAELGDDRLGARVRVLQAMIQVFGPGSADDQGSGAAAALDLARDTVSTLEAHSDDGGLARAWRLMMLLDAMLGLYDDAAEAAKRVIEHANRGGERRLASRSASAIAWTLVHGATPVGEAIDAIQGLLETTAGDRKTEAVLLGALAQLESMRGRFDEARPLYQRGQAILAELGAGLDAHTTSIDSARVELLAGDLAAAERELRRDYEALDALGETYFRSSIAGMLAHVLLQAGQSGPAAEFASVAEAISDAEDVVSQIVWKSARARLLAGDGDRAAESLAREAVDAAAATADVELRGDTLTDLGAVLGALGRAEDAAAAYRQAIEHYERKGDVVSVALVRNLLEGGVERPVLHA